VRCSASVCWSGLCSTAGSSCRMMDIWCLQQKFYSPALAPGTEADD
jgi:hypothetical protein